MRLLSVMEVQAFLSPQWYEKNINRKNPGRHHQKNCIKKLFTKFREATTIESIWKYVNNMHGDA